MTLVAMAAIGALGLVSLSAVAVTWRLLSGPSAADRVIATDMLGLIAIAIATIAAVLAGHAAYLDIAFAIALFGFLGAVAFAGLLEGSAEAREGTDQ